MYNRGVIVPSEHFVKKVIIAELKTIRDIVTYSIKVHFLMRNVVKFIKKKKKLYNEPKYLSVGVEYYIYF